MPEKLTPVQVVDAKLRRRGTMLWKVCKVDRSAPIRWLKERGGQIPDTYFGRILAVSLQIRAGITRSDLVV